MARKAKAPSYRGVSEKKIKKRPVASASGRSTINVSRRRKGVASQARSASGGQRSIHQAVGSRLARAKKLRPAARAHEFTTITREGEERFSKQFAKPNVKAKQLASIRESNAAARELLTGVGVGHAKYGKSGFVSGKRRRLGTESRSSGPTSLGMTAVKARRAAAKKRKRQAESASRSSRR